MFAPKLIASWVTTVLLGISGLISNGFIVKMMITQWTKCRSLASSEQLFLSLGLSNLCATIALSVFYFVIIFAPSYLTSQLSYSFVFFAVIFRFWLTALLCFFYCIKIVNSTHALFLWCKLRLSWLIMRFLVGSLLISLFTLIVTFSNVYVLPQKNMTTNVTRKSQEKSKIEYFIRFKLFFSTIGCVGPLVMVFLCSFLVVASLCGHVCQMRGKESHLRSFQTKAHIKAAGTVLSLLFLYILFFVAQSRSLTVDMGGNESFFVNTPPSVLSSSGCHPDSY
ncbi:taste receptor type 2 member 41-like [Sceloporus undulatus]|uniref:taste receptor type 2 member 41-like n=1 Tax=Sceloporus undulatus TaxID=8520 RepID=UPI001C4C6C8A|nr:taste receptor type 2 member 41-like [Sceloporus undulatus]